MCSSRGKTGEGGGGGVSFQCGKLRAFWMRLVAFRSGCSKSGLEEASADVPGPDVGILSLSVESLGVENPHLYVGSWQSV